MKIVEDVYEIANSFMKSPEYVFINYDEVEKMALTLKKTEKIKFPLPDVYDVFKAIVLELVAASINYCYWYGRDCIRPGDASSTRMYELLTTSFFDFYIDEGRFKECINRYIKLLASNRFPLLEERVRHLNELKGKVIEYCIFIENSYNSKIYSYNLPFLFQELIETFPGFASDIFLKRASLFFLQLNRRFGWFKDELQLLHIPADYQVPKVFKYYNLMKYDEELEGDIFRNVLIPKHSRPECEIRSATILIAKKLCDLTGWNVADIDTYFFLKKKEISSPFHLTITTDY